MMINDDKPYDIDQEYVKPESWWNVRIHNNFKEFLEKKTPSYIQL